MRNRDDITNSVAFFRLAKVADILGEKRVSEAHLILVH